MTRIIPSFILGTLVAIFGFGLVMVPNIKEKLILGAFELFFVMLLLNEINGGLQDRGKKGIHFPFYLFIVVDAVLGLFAASSILLGININDRIIIIILKILMSLGLYCENY